MTKPFFSVIIPALNEAEHLPLLLGDLAAQSFRDFEVIVVDGKSDDETVSKAKSFRKSLTALKIVTSDTRHVCVQRNLGAKHALAETLVFMDADDRVQDYFLLGLQYRLSSSPADLATTWIEPDQRDTVSQIISAAVNQFQELKIESNSPFLLEALIVIKKYALLKVGGFDPSIPYSEGDALAKKCVEQGFIYRIYHDPKYTFSFRRLRKYGAVNLNTRVIAIQLLKSLNIQLAYNQAKKLYPMEGGAALMPGNDSKHFMRKSEIFRELDKLLSKIKVKNRPLSIKTLTKRFHKFLND